MELVGLIDESTRIIEAARKKDIVLRLIGACAVKIHCPRFQQLYSALKRELTDIDLITYGKYNEQIKQLFIEMGYIADKKLELVFGGKRHLYRHGKHNWKIDVFFDKLEMCHTITFLGRLELDYPTITLADIILEKMQIVQINEKDIKDTIILLRQHQVGEKEKETVNAKYIAKVLARDWGFWYTVTTNLNKVKNYLKTYQALADEDRVDVASKIKKIIQYVNGEPKSLRWKIRSKVGPSKKWYRDVEEVIR